MHTQQPGAFVADEWIESISQLSMI